MAIFHIAFSQDAYFVCFQRTLLYHNPAFAGSSGTLRTQAGANYLWPGAGGYFSTYMGIDSYAGKGGSWGWSVQNQAEGELFKKWGTSFYYSNRISLFKKRLILQPGISVSFIQNSLDWNKVNYSSEIDINKGFMPEFYKEKGLNKRSNLDLSGGILLFNKYFFCGLSAAHITQPDEGFMGSSKLPMRIGLQAAGMIRLNEYILISPSIQYFAQMDFQFLSLGCTAVLKKWATGINYSPNGFMAINTGWQNENMLLGISHSFFYRGIPYTTSFGGTELNFSFKILEINAERKFIQPAGF